jgi:hypothetical protein
MDFATSGLEGGDRSAVGSAEFFQRGRVHTVKRGNLHTNTTTPLWTVCAVMAKAPTASMTRLSCSVTCADGWCQTILEKYFPRWLE